VDANGDMSGLPDGMSMAPLSGLFWTLLASFGSGEAHPRCGVRIGHSKQASIQLTSDEPVGRPPAADRIGWRASGGEERPPQCTERHFWDDRGNQPVNQGGRRLRYFFDVRVRE